MKEPVTEQAALTVIVEIEEGKEDALRALLKEIGDVVDLPACPIDFRKFTTVHFMRWVVLGADKDARGKDIPAQLVLSTNYDLPLEGHLQELVAVGGATLDKIYSHCKGYTGAKGLLPYLRGHRVDYAAFYVGTRGRSVAQVRNEEKLRGAIEGYLDRRPQGASQEPAVVRAEIRRFVFESPELAWARAEPDWAGWRLRLYGPPLLVLLVLLAAWVAALVLAPPLLGAPWWAVPVATVALALLAAAPLVGLFLIVLFHEWNDPEDDIRTDVGQVDHVKVLVQREDQVVQNQLSHLANVKPQLFRARTLRLVLGAINLLARYVYVRGTLGGIPTIHFARWVILDGGRRLLFFSNFDESWENYLGHFIDKAARGLTAVWSNTVGCPKAKGLIGAGARDEQRFKSWTREHQIFTQVWYSAYEELSVDNINNNSAIRMGLYGELSPAEAEAWLARL
jgi:hypothetical protein